MNPDEAYLAMVADIENGAEFSDAVTRWADRIDMLPTDSAVDYLTTRYDAEQRP